MVLYAVVGSLCRGILSGLGVPGIIVQPCGNVKRESVLAVHLGEHVAETVLEHLYELLLELKTLSCDVNA